MRWLEKSGYKDEAAAALQRATATFCKTRPDIHLFAMHFDERHGNIDSARGRYKLVLGELAPRLISASVAAANFERRQVCGLPGGVLKGKRLGRGCTPDAQCVTAGCAALHLLHSLTSQMQGNRHAACEVFENLIKEEQSKDDSSSKSTMVFLSMQYANFLRVAYKDFAKGRHGEFGAWQFCGRDTCGR